MHSCVKALCGLVAVRCAALLDFMDLPIYSWSETEDGFMRRLLATKITMPVE